MTAIRTWDPHRSADPLIPCSPRSRTVRSATVPPLSPVRSDGCVAKGPRQSEAADHRMVQDTLRLCRQCRVVQAAQDHRPAGRPRREVLQVLLRVHTTRSFGSQRRQLLCICTEGAPSRQLLFVLAVPLTLCSFVPAPAGEGGGGSVGGRILPPPGPACA